MRQQRRCGETRPLSTAKKHASQEQSRMMNLYPDAAPERLEFDKIRDAVAKHTRSDAARERVAAMRFMTRVETVQRALDQTAEYRTILVGGEPLPADPGRNLTRELRLLQVQGAVLTGDELVAISKLALTIRDVLRWFHVERQEDYPTLWALAEKVSYEKEIANIVGKVVDDNGVVRDNASRELLTIRSELVRARSDLRRMFESIVRKLSKQGYLADISEGFLNGRRTVAVTATHKRVVKGILHGESESSQTVFIEPEETIELNNEIFSLERAEAREVQRILAETTAALSPFAQQLEGYYHLIGLYDFIRAKALFAIEIDAHKPAITAHPGFNLIRAFHPLLLLHHRAQGKSVVPVNLRLDREGRILIISGPNAGGKTVSMKTVGLLQLMVQAGLLIPADPSSEVGLFKQLFIHIGDTQSIEHELSTYSAHLRDMKHFMDFANGKTLFFIDELGSGSDPALGGAFAEAIVEELANRNAIGIITTHYLNLKVMAGKVGGIINGAMAFDEEKLEPLYQLTTGKPGSSYTFAIAQRTGLPQRLIDRARKLTERGHFKLDKLLHKTEQQAIQLEEKEDALLATLREAERMKKEYEDLIDKERRKQHIETLKLQNKIKKEELDYLRDTERKFKQIIHDWKKSENKEEVIGAAEKVLFRRKAIAANQSAAKKTDKAYETVGGAVQVGDLVRNKTTHGVGTVTEIRGPRAIVKIGKLPFNVELAELVVVRKRSEKKGK